MTHGVCELLWLRIRTFTSYKQNPTKFEKGLGKGLLFKRNEKLEMEVYIEIDYAGFVMDRKSTSGYFMFLGGNLITFETKYCCKF